MYVVHRHTCRWETHTYQVKINTSLKALLVDTSIILGVTHRTAREHSPRAGLCLVFLGGDLLQRPDLCLLCWQHFEVRKEQNNTDLYFSHQHSPLTKPSSVFLLHQGLKEHLVLCIAYFLFYGSQVTAFRHLFCYLKWESGMPELFLPQVSIKA